MSNQEYYSGQGGHHQGGGYPQQPQPSYGPPQGNYGPPQGHYDGGYQQGHQPPMQYQQGPPPEASRGGRKGGSNNCLMACIAALCCCCVAEEACECWYVIQNLPPIPPPSDPGHPPQSLAPPTNTH
ncbi:cysteine-rich TM module stress tolerance domain-containing protein [Hirsutella rhossiliensis]